MNLGFALLLAGHMREGWLENEWRWQSTTHRPRGFRSPLWEGEPLAGKTILVHSEQGFGDTIHFVRYAGELSRRGANVVLLVQPALVRLVSASFRGCQVLGAEEDVPPHDFNVPLFSLARLCWTGDPPLARQYLRPDRKALGQWADFNPEGLLRVGLAWQGNPRHRRDHERSFPLRVCAPLARLGGVRLYNLQGGEGRAQASDPQLGFEVIEPAHPLADFSDTAACLQKLDIVVSCDSAVAHLAGALGRPCWLALPFSPDWRWGTRGDTSAWYPSLRLFRQPCPGDWESVFSRMAEAIASRDQRPAQRKESHAGTTGSL